MSKKIFAGFFLTFALILLAGAGCEVPFGGTNNVVPKALEDSTCDKEFSQNCLQDILIKSEERTVEADKKLFDNLKTVDVVRLEKNKPFLVGTFRDTTFKAMSPGEIAKHLIESHTIKTFQHVEAYLCQSFESPDNTVDIYKTRFEVLHKYYTNACNQDRYWIEIKINKHSGNITVEKM